MEFRKVIPAVAVLLSTANLLFAQSPAPDTNLTERQQEIVAAAAIQASPQFNGANVIGTHPNAPLIYSLTASGNGPISYFTRNLPAGLQLDPETGLVTGTLSKTGDYQFQAFAKNSDGRAQTEIKIKCGDQLALTPPLGWNSYDTFGDSVTETETLANAQWMREHLHPFGWDTVVVDFRWYDPHPTGDDRLLNPTRTGAALAADDFGRLLPAPDRFPSAASGLGFKPLADQLHSLGLKFGIHVMRGIPRQAVLANTGIFGGEFNAADAGDTNDKCGWCPDMFGVRDNAAGQAWYDSCARLWASWGVDYIKVDDLSEPYHLAEIDMIHRALAKVDHSIIFSTSPGPTSTAHAGHIAADANLWRISGDFWDRWPKINDQFDLLAQWQGAGGPGHWPDADMIPLGHIAIRSKLGGNPHWTHFTREEQLTLLSLWALAPSPLMLGMNLPDNDDWTTAILTNPEVLAVNQDPLGNPARRIFGVQASAEVWVRQLVGGDYVVGLFNRTSQTVAASCDWQKEGISTIPEIRDLWLRKNLARQKTFSAEIPPHGCLLLRLSN
ncbi:MAG: putative Ig domain-containing protein [Verrucomicrobiota bacterium]